MPRGPDAMRWGRGPMPPPRPELCPRGGEGRGLVCAALHSPPGQGDPHPSGSHLQVQGIR